MSLSEVIGLPVSVDIATAGRAHGIGRSKATQLAREGRFPCPVQKIGRTYHILRTDLLASLAIDDVAIASVDRLRASA